MKIRSLALCLIAALVLVSCFTPDTGPPILDGEQRLVIGNGTYEYNVTDIDTFFHFHLDYYVSRDSCIKGNYAIQWQNGLGRYVNIDYLYGIAIHAGNWYEWNGTFRVSKSEIESGGDPIVTIEAHHGETLLTVSDTMEFMGDR